MPKIDEKQVVVQEIAENFVMPKQRFSLTIVV